MTTHRQNRLSDIVRAALGGVPAAALPQPLPGAGANARRVALALRIARLRDGGTDALPAPVVVPLALALTPVGKGAPETLPEATPEALPEAKPATMPAPADPPAPSRPRRAPRVSFSSVSLDDAALLLSAATGDHDGRPEAAAPGIAPVAESGAPSPRPNLAGKDAVARAAQALAALGSADDAPDSTANAPVPGDHPGE